MYILRNCKLIPALTEGYDGELCDVLIDGDIISQIQNPGYCFSSKVKEYDLQGKTLMPGMYDLHTHLSYSGYGDMHDGGRDAYRTVLDTVMHAQNCLRAGFTSLRDSGGEPFVCARVKEAIDTGAIVGPNLTVCGRLMSPTELSNNANPFVEKTIHEVNTPEEIRTGVREEIRDGANYIKYVASGAISLKGSDPFVPIATNEEIEALVKEAAFKGKYVAAHVHGTECIKQCIRAGVRTLEHASVLDEECIEMLKEKTAFIIGTVNLYGSMLGGAETPEYAKCLESNAANIVRDQAIKGLKMANDAGLVIGFGTDSGMVNLFHGQNAKGLVYYVRLCGLDEVSTLKHATIDCAEILGEQDCRGTVKAGKIADLIVIDGDPTKEIERIADSVVMVIKSGSIVSNLLD